MPSARCSVINPVTQAAEAAEFDDAITKLAVDTFKANDDAVGDILKKCRVNPKSAEDLARHLRGNRALLSEVTQAGSVAVSCPIVLALELEEIRASREKRDPKRTLERLPMEDDPELIGLALSGGGIRSATFNLGILQGLADLDLLRHVDYLSTVSGGGYIGGWLAAWCKREVAGDVRGIRKVQTTLSPMLSPNPASKEQAPLRFLREYSNYLTPQSGFFTADTWTVVTEWIRNTLLNQTVLVLFLAFVLLVPHALARVAFSTSTGWQWALLAAAVAGFTLATLAIAVSMSSFDHGRSKAPQPPAEESEKRTVAERLKGFRKRAIQPTWVRYAVVVPALIAAFAFTVWHVPGVLALATRGLNETAQSVEATSVSWPTATWSAALRSLGVTPPGLAAQRVAQDAFLVALILILSLGIVSVFGRFDRCFYDGREGKNWNRKGLAWLCIGVSAVLAGLFGGVLTVLFSRIWLMGITNEVVHQALKQTGSAFAGIQPSPSDIAQAQRDWISQRGEHLAAAFVFGPPLLLQVSALTVVAHVGLLGRNLPDERREWWSRLGAWVLIFCFGWILISGISLYGSPIFTAGTGLGMSSLQKAGGITWVATTIFGLLSAQSARTGPKARDTGWRAKLMNAVALAAPYIFIAGLLVLISHVLHQGLGEEPGAPGAIDAKGSVWLPLILALVCLLLATVLSWRFDVNEFSMHHFYKNRLVRCYLGASRPKERDPNSFTGFDPNDEVKLATLRVDPICQEDQPYVGPYPIVNAALNLVGGENLAWQERKAESFVFTPQFCGYAYSKPDTKETSSRQRCTAEAYRPTNRYGYGKDGGIGLGTAMAISGAAANPNMGYHSSPAVSFLMTMFNVRLGWWLGNPRGTKWERSSPRLGLHYFLKELTGATTDTSSYVNLSDGGHFENIGLYELVRRRCKYIVACDASQDRGPAFADLGNAIRKCRTDLGVEIEVPLDRMRELAKEGPARAHGTVGTICYPNGASGWLLYIKTSLTRDESADVLEYSIRQPDFPNQSTTDQWFDESQFESYRKLGHHSAHSMLETAVRDWERKCGLQVLFEDLDALWLPPTPEISKAGEKHAEKYDALMERVRAQGLEDLDAVLFPGAHIAKKRGGNGSGNGGTPRDDFYVINSLIQLMETVVIDLNMDEEGSHPHNKGWVTIFGHWAQSPLLREVWYDSGYTYSQRFQRFCEKTLKLKKPRSEE